MTEEFDKTHVKILVHTKVEDGYPSEEWESLWAIPIGNGCFKIDNIPFYAKNLSCDDIVETKYDGENHIFKKILFPSENSTFRVVVYDLEYEVIVRNVLNSLGVNVEGTGTPGLLALNIPKLSVEAVLYFLEEEFADEKLDFEEGVLRV